MPDASGGVVSGLYWVATGRMPLDEVENAKEPSKEQPEPSKDEKLVERARGGG